MKGFVLILFGLFLDGLVAMFTLASAVFIPLLGPLGAGIGMTIGIALTITLGGAFVLVSALTGMFSPKLTVSIFFGEMIPILNILPGWTILAIVSAVRHRAEEGKGGLMTTLTTVALSASPGGSTSGFQAARASLGTPRVTPVSPQEHGRAEQSRTPSKQFTFTQSVDGLRAANNNQPYVKKAA